MLSNVLIHFHIQVLSKLWRLLACSQQSLASGRGGGLLAAAKPLRGRMRRLRRRAGERAARIFNFNMNFLMRICSSFYHIIIFFELISSFVLCELLEAISTSSATAIATAAATAADAAAIAIAPPPAAPQRNQPAAADAPSQQSACTQPASLHPARQSAPSQSACTQPPLRKNPHLVGTKSSLQVSTPFSGVDDT